MYRPSVASLDVLAVELNEREEREREAVVEDVLISIKIEGPSVAVQSVNVDSVMESVHDEEMVADIAAPLPLVYSRSVKAHESIVADPPEVIETAELNIVTAESGVDDWIEMLSSVRVPPLTLTT